MKVTPQQIIVIAGKEVGVKESPANSNKVKYNHDFYGRDVYDGLDGAVYPWCCSFVWWVFKSAGLKLKKTASCMTLGQWFKDNGRWKTNNPKVGDVVFFKFSSNSRWANHVGIVIDVLENGSIKTIEGNTSTEFNKKGSQDNGGCVAIRTRKSNIVGYGTPPYDSEDEIDYYDRCLTNTNSFVDALKHIDVDSSMAHRKKIAQANGIINYSATTSQNIYLLKLLKNGKLIKE